MGLLVAAVLAVAVWRLRRRLELVGDAAHELRGPVTALSYALAWLRREPGGAGLAARFEAELERMRAGLADLDAARAGRRAPARARSVALEPVVRSVADGWRSAVVGAEHGVAVRWEAGRAHVNVDPGRLAQALGNVLANAVEHGSGPIEIHAVCKGPRAVRVEVCDAGPAAPVSPVRTPDRGRGLGIARRAVREAGGELTLDRQRSRTIATIELPVEETA